VPLPALGLQVKGSLRAVPPKREESSLCSSAAAAFTGSANRSGAGGRAIKKALDPFGEGEVRISANRELVARRAYQVHRAGLRRVDAKLINLDDCQSAPKYCAGIYIDNIAELR
jgi:hypothetical protein